jgi:hypothetical protein
MSRKMIAVIVCLALVLTASASRAAPTIIHQYDFEPTPAYSPVTQAGWTHVDYQTFYTPTTAGWDSTRSFFYYNTPYDEPGQTATPYTQMQRDFVGNLPNYPTAGQGIVFREIVPANAGYLKFTIWRNSLDVYAPAFTTTVQLADVTNTTFTTIAFDAGSSNPADRSTPITGQMNFCAGRQRSLRRFRLRCRWGKDS